MRKQRALWKDLGRSDETWQAWVDSIPPPPGWTTLPRPDGFIAVHRVVSNVVLKDLDGTAWPSDRFLRKTTIAVVWATWCGPCLKELPYFNQLFERFKSREDVQVVSFDVDENPGLAEEFVRKHGYRFPVLLAKHAAERLMPYLSIPRTWIIREGTMVEENDGFSGDGAQWVERVVAQAK
jgi:thiol-disulfide isomerase/thioredoxin